MTRIPRVLDPSFVEPRVYRDHDTGDEDPSTEHTFVSLDTSQIEFLLAQGARDAGYLNPRSPYYLREKSHASWCGLETGKFWCNCIGPLRAGTGRY